jgi:hypothetical protein
MNQYGQIIAKTAQRYKTFYGRILLMFHNKLECSSLQAFTALSNVHG